MTLVLTNNDTVTNVNLDINLQLVFSFDNYATKSLLFEWFIIVYFKHFKASKYVKVEPAEDGLVEEQPIDLETK